MNWIFCVQTIIWTWILRSVNSNHSKYVFHPYYVQLLVVKLLHFQSFWSNWSGNKTNAVTELWGWRTHDLQQIKKRSRFHSSNLKAYRECTLFCYLVRQILEYESSARVSHQRWAWVDSAVVGMHSWCQKLIHVPSCTN